MLVIREEQRQTLVRYMVRQFENRMVSSLTNRYPEDCDTLTESELRVLIRAGIRSARHYGIEIEDDVARYISLCILLGLTFDAACQVPWVKEVLEDETLHPTTRIDRLIEHVEAQDHGTQPTWSSLRRVTS